MHGGSAEGGCINSECVWVMKHTECESGGDQNTESVGAVQKNYYNLVLCTE